MDTPRTVLIIGVGLLGGSLALALHSIPGTVVRGADTNPDALGEALQRGAVTNAVHDWRDGAADADLIIFCTPPAHIVSHIRAACDLARPGAIVTDVGSVKGKIADAAGDAPNYVGSHPMAGSEQGGMAHAHAALFSGAAWCVCPTPFSSPLAVQTVTDLARAVRAVPMTLPPDVHDDLLAVTSHLPHALAAALMNVAGQTRRSFPELPELSAGSFRDATRVALSSPALWRDICLLNAGAVRECLQAAQAQLSQLDAALSAGDAAAVEAFFASAQQAKREWEG